MKTTQHSNQSVHIRVCYFSLHNKGSLEVLAYLEPPYNSTRSESGLEGSSELSTVIAPVFLEQALSAHHYQQWKILSKCRVHSTRDWGGGFGQVPLEEGTLFLPSSTGS